MHAQGRTERRHTPPAGRATPAAARLVRTIRIHTETLRRQAARERLRPDRDAVHDLRVAGRRLRATLELFESALAVPLARRARDRVVRLTRGAGAIRDWDVFTAGVQARVKALPPSLQPALAAPMAAWQRERARLHARLAATLRSPAFAGLLRALDRLADRLESGAAPMEAPALDKAARARLRRLLKHTRRAGRSLGRRSSDKKFHRLRILCRRLRHGAECLGAVRGDATADFVAQATRLQAALGHHQDLAVEARQLCAVLESPAAGRAPALRRALAAMLDEMAGEQAQSREACLKAWRRFDRHPSRRTLFKHRR